MTALPVKTVDYKRVYINEYSSCYMNATVSTFIFKNEIQRGILCNAELLGGRRTCKGCSRQRGMAHPVDRTG
jgi:hypothetical protein